MDREELNDLLERYTEGGCTDEERAWVEDWYNRHHLKADGTYTEEQIEADAKMLWAKLPPSPQKLLFRTWYKYVSIAAAMLLAYLALNRWSFKDWTKPNLPQQAQLESILPGGSRATLTLADGRVISLGDSQNGVLAQQNGFVVKKNADGVIIYQIDKGTESTATGNEGYNTISTPKGGHYQVRLPDGSKVWLNAASTLTYVASSVHSNRREVRLSGEAYFEVAHNAQSPFIVKTNRQEIEVLGTHFNVNDYDSDTRTVTTLLEGKVMVSQLNSGAASRKVVLKPGQAADLTDQKLTVKPADVELATAWKNGRIEFNDATLDEIMPMIGRWYNLDIRFEGNLPLRRFSGSIPNNKNLYRVLEALQLGNVNFEMIEKNGKRTLVLKP